MSTKRIWKGKNKCDRVREFRNNIKKAQIEPECAEKTTKWFDVFEEALRKECKKEYENLINNPQSISITRVGEGLNQSRIVKVDQRDDKRRYRNLIKDTVKKEDGTSESILKKVNEELKKEFPEDDYPILRLKDSNKLINCLRYANEATKKDLFERLDFVRDAMLGGKRGNSEISHIRRNLRKQASALRDLDTLDEYQAWSLPESQSTGSGEEQMITVQKAIHVTEHGTIPRGSKPENAMIANLESNKDVVFYIRNPQGNQGLAIRYDFESQTYPTYPDFIVVKGDLNDASTWRINIIETKGGEDRKRDQHKYKGLGDYVKIEEIDALGVKCLWVEFIDEEIHFSEPSATKYLDRTQGQFDNLI